MAKKVSGKVLQGEDKKTHDYEMVLIISPEVVDDKLGLTIDNVSKFITDNGGVVSEVEQWGKKKLAYPIKHYLEGNYVLTRFKLITTSIKELEVSLHISDDVLRHLLIQLDS